MERRRIMYYTFPAFARMALARRPADPAGDDPKPPQPGPQTVQQIAGDVQEAVAPSHEKEAE